MTTARDPVDVVAAWIHCGPATAARIVRALGVQTADQLDQYNTEDLQQIREVTD